MSIDLRNVPPEQFLSLLKKAMGEDGLLTYRYLGRKSTTMHGAEYDSMKIRRDMRNAEGGIMAAPLMIATAETGGFTDFNAVPAPVTAGLTIIDAGKDVAEIVIDREIVHQGRNMGFTRSIIRDAANPDRVLAFSRGIGIKLAEAPPSEGEYLDIGEEIPDSPDLPPLIDVFGGRRRPDKLWELPPLEAGSTSTSGSLHLGPIHLVLETAAQSAADEATGGAPLQIVDWTVMFTARGVIGPFVAQIDRVCGTGDRIAVDVTLRDAGKNNRAVASGAGVFRRG